jgi:hypothetical protein
MRTTSPLFSQAYRQVWVVDVGPATPPAVELPVGRDTGLDRLVSGFPSPTSRTTWGTPHPRPFESVDQIGDLHRDLRKNVSRPASCPMGTTCWGLTICLGYVMEARPTHKMHTCLAVRITRGIFPSIICLGYVTNASDPTDSLTCLAIRITVCVSPLPLSVWVMSPTPGTLGCYPSIRPANLYTLAPITSNML